MAESVGWRSGRRKKDWKGKDGEECRERKIVRKCGKGRMVK